MTTTPDLTVQRVRHELKRRSLRVRRTTQLSPSLVRITLAGDDLEGFVSASFDDHVKLFFPGDEKRDYTPRRYDAAARELDIEFVLHGDGPACTWAGRAQVGDSLDIGGPRGSFIVPMGYDWHLLAGDETALPAIARRLEELPATAKVIAVIEVEAAQDEVPLAGGAGREIVWVHRQGQAPGALERAVRALSLPGGEGYAWAAGEASVMRAVHQHLVAERGLDKSRIRASAYWKRGAVAVHESVGE